MSMEAVDPYPPPQYLDMVLICYMADVLLFELVKPLANMDVRDAPYPTRVIRSVRIHPITICSAGTEIELWRPRWRQAS
jgi:hypothetical protein